MAVSSFEELCAGFCELASVPTPQLIPDAHGLLAFHAVLKGVTVNVVHCPERDAEHAFVLVEFGTAPANEPALSSLLDANFCTFRADVPVFARNPVDGSVLMQRAYPLEQASAHGLFDMVHKGVEMALQWRTPAAAIERYIPAQPHVQFA